VPSVLLEVPRAPTRAARWRFALCLGLAEVAIPLLDDAAGDSASDELARCCFGLDRRAHAAFQSKPKHAHLATFFRPISDQITRALHK